MPCYDAYNDNRPHVVTKTQTVYIEKNKHDIEKIARLKDRVQWLEGALCALITEIEKRGIAHEVLPQASRSGLIDLMQFWKDHSKEDEWRIANELHKFSEHEQAIIKKLLSSQS